MNQWLRKAMLLQTSHAYELPPVLGQVVFGNTRSFWRWKEVMNYKQFFLQAFSIGYENWGRLVQMDRHLIHIRLYRLDTKTQSSQTYSQGSKVNNLLHSSFTHYINWIKLWRYTKVWLYIAFISRNENAVRKTNNT